MTIGPAPMTRMDERSVRLGTGLRFLCEGWCEGGQEPLGPGRPAGAGPPGGVGWRVDYESGGDDLPVSVVVAAGRPVGLFLPPPR